MPRDFQAAVVQFLPLGVRKKLEGMQFLSRAILYFSDTLRPPSIVISRKHLLLLSDSFHNSSLHTLSIMEEKKKQKQKQKETKDQLEGHVSGQANKPLSRPAHTLGYLTVIEEIKADADDGLTTSEARARLEEYGRNEFGDTGGVQPAKILLRQVANAMTLVMPTIFLPWEEKRG